MNRSQQSDPDSYKKLKSLIEEYEERKDDSPVPNWAKNLRFLIGCTFYDTETNKTYLCNGSINGEPVWTLIN